MTTEFTPAVVAAAVSLPLTKLIESVSKGVGAWYEPIGIQRKAKAQAEANLTLTTAAIEERALLERAVHRFAFVEGRRQSNIESIVEEAKQNLPSTVSEEPVADDWMVKFFDNCKDVGEPDLQKLWARLLAGEVTQPRTYSRRTMEALRMFSLEDAKIFDSVCKYSFVDTFGTRFVFVGCSPLEIEAMKEIPDPENYLASLGLLNTEKESLPGRHRDWHIQCSGREFIIPQNLLIPVRPTSHDFEIRRFTAVGNDLAKIIPYSPTFPQGFIDALRSALFVHQIQLLTRDEHGRLLKEREKDRPNFR
jgi:hypothetical protein